MIKDLELFFEEIKNLNVLVVGETIVDEFIDVSYEGQSMKSICPVFKLEGAKIIQQGGAQAIANHIYDFVKHVNVFTNTNSEIVKTRYVDVSDKKKHVDFGHGFCDKLSITDGFHLMCQTNSNNFGFNRISKWKNLKKKSACIDLREASLQVNERISNPNQQDIIDIFNYELNN